MKFVPLVPFFIAAILVLAVACGSNGPTPAVGPQNVPEIEKAAVELLDDWLEATQKHDAAAVHGLLASNITDACTLEQFEQFFERDDNSFTYPEMDIVGVFVAAGNSEEAFISMELRNEPEPGRRGIIDAYVAATPFKIVREDGKWRIVFQIITVADGCPFEGSFSRSVPVPADPTPSP